MPFPALPDRLREIREKITRSVVKGGHGQTVTLIAVTNTHGPGAVEAAWQAGIVDVGENRVQEALAKMAQVSVPVRWHLIGHLQRNKVKSLPDFVMMHSLDSARLADAVHGVGVQSGRPIQCLVEVNVSGEESKGGFDRDTLPAEAERLRGLTGITVRGVMTMAPLDADEATLRRVFSGARRARQILCDAGHAATELSMGMSNDYEVAVEEGATYVRVGTALFGAREAI